MESRAMTSLRKVLQGPPRQSGSIKTEERAQRSKQALKPEEAEMDRDDEWNPLELPMSGNAMAHICEIDASKLMPTDLIGMEDVYTTLTIVIIDWLRLKGGVVDSPTLEDAASHQEAEIVILAERVAEENVEIPEEIERCWEEAQGMRRSVIRYHEARLEDWDKARRERLEGMRRFLSVIFLHSKRLFAGLTPSKRAEIQGLVAIMVNPQITNLVIILGMMQVSKKIPFEDPQVLMGVRGLYIASNLIIMGIYLYMQSRINSKKDLTTLKYVEPAPMGSSEEPKLVTTTIHSYDQQQLRAMFKSQLMGVGMMGVMHLYFQYTNPLLIQSIIPLKGAFEGNLFKIYVLGQPAAGELKRPWKAAGGFMGMGGAGEVKSDKKSIELAERAGSGGAKEE